VDAVGVLLVLLVTIEAPSGMRESMILGSSKSREIRDHLDAALG
jgi:hypothetical protein